MEAPTLLYSGSNIQDEIREHLFRRVTTMFTTPRRGGISRYLHTEVDEDTIPDVMNSTGEFGGRDHEENYEMIFRKSA